MYFLIQKQTNLFCGYCSHKVDNENHYTVNVQPPDLDKKYTWDGENFIEIEQEEPTT